MGILKPASFTAGHRISFGEAQVALVPPVLTMGVNHVTGGSWSANTYFWVLTATDAEGESLPSNEVTNTMIEAGSIDFTWAAVSGATGYKLYRGLVSGSQNKRVVSLGDVVEYTDLGNTGTSASPPATATDVGLKVYEVGDTIPNATVKAIKHLGALLGKRSIIPNLDPFRRKTKLETPTPTDLSPKMKGTL